MLMVNISRGRAAWLAGTAANFGDVNDAGIFELPSRG